MIAIGSLNQLECLRHTPHGAFLGDGEGTEILLPAKYVPDSLSVGAQIEVFCYLDGQERPVATTLTPRVQRNGFAFLQVVETKDFGAFLDWGLEKHLFLPLREQQGRPVVGDTCLVYCYMDSSSFRLVASMRYKRFTIPATEADFLNKEVQILPARTTDLGWEVVVDQKHLGLLYFDRIHGDLQVGVPLRAFVTKVREDGKLDIDLRPHGYAFIDDAVQHLFSVLVRNDGFLPFTDRTEPELLRTELGQSKKTFKKAVGWLYRKRCISLEEGGIRLLRDRLPMDDGE